MANKVTGSTDISGALGVVPISVKSIIILGELKADTGETVETTVVETIFPIGSTVDARNKFGSLSPIPNMVKAMITNKATNIKGMIIGEYGDGKTYTAKADAYTAALAKTMNDQSIMFIQLDTNDSTLASAIKVHLDSAESEDLFRYHITSMVAGKTNSEYGVLAGTVNHSRIFLVGPSTIDAASAAMDGLYLASGLAAVVLNECLTDPALPVNGVKIAGFSGLERILLNADKGTLITAGVSPVYMDDGGITIYRLVTTYTKNSEGLADVTWQDATTRFIADYVLEHVESRLRANYPRTKNVARILSSIRTDVIGVLQDANDLEIIQNFDKNTVSVIKDSDDRYGALVDYEFQVVTPLYTITINQHMKL